MKAIKGEWVNIHKIILSADERAPQIPEDTKKVAMELWVKGFLVNDDAMIGDEVNILTITNRKETGKLIDIKSYSSEEKRDSLTVEQKEPRI